MNEENKELVTEKECTKCHLIKPLSDYRKQSKAKYGVKPHCRECDDLIQGELYLRNKKRIIKQVMSRRKLKNKLERQKDRELKELTKSGQIPINIIPENNEEISQKSLDNQPVIV